MDYVAYQRNFDKLEQKAKTFTSHTMASHRPLFGVATFLQTLASLSVFVAVVATAVMFRHCHVRRR
ncbi:hypothetical protein HDF16_002809 [Granulicella aggregans]|uniref:Uncharacterized protein n=1 Tax=Granulicella aggregans TaxID=474949 RepID=A0A7W7ZDY4_9BACT|nr:hypothetical protein [Granulicella aggregans]